MKTRGQANNNNNLNDPTVANDPHAQVEDLPMSGEQEERVKGGGEVFISLPDDVVVDRTRKGESKR